MEPAMAFTVVVGSGMLACVALDGLRSVVSAPRSFATTLPTGARPLVAALLVAGSLVALRPWGAGATVPPPSVRSFAPSAATPGDTAVPPSAAGEPADVIHTYTVTPGDCLWRIARTLLISRGQEVDGHRVTALWTAIYERNRAVIGSNPNLIHPGQILEIPSRG